MVRNETTLRDGLSIVIPHYGDPAPTLELIAALQTQRARPDIEIIVVDDASPVPFGDTDGVIVVRRSVNGGFGSAVNSGVERATRARLLILNSDLDVSETFLGDMVDASEPWMPAVTGPRVLDRHGRYTWSGRSFPTTTHQTVEWLTPPARWRHLTSLHAAVGHDVRCEPGRDTPVDWLVGAALYLPTETFRDVGGFDESFYMNSEEVDLQRRLRARGLPSIQLGDVAVHHEGGGSSGDSEKRRRWLVESRIRYADKWGSARPLKVALGAATLVNLGHNTLRRAAGRPAHPLRTARFELSLLGCDGRR